MLVTYCTAVSIVFSESLANSLSPETEEFKMLLQQEIRLADQSGTSYARASSCTIHIEETFFGYRLHFNFSLDVYPKNDGREISLETWEMDLYFNDSGRSVLLGRMLRQLNEHSERLGRHGFTLTRYFDVANDDFVQFIDKSHHGDVTFEFRATPVFSGLPYNGAMETGRLVVPHSQWLELLNNAGHDRYELISIRIPVSDSHRHKPFADAVTKIREAECQYTRGDWNGAASSCRSAWANRFIDCAVWDIAV
jgi:hypothetical protein